jgi:Kef-type K+ transport system membrane component KefB
MSFKTNLKQTKEKGSTVPFNNNVTSILFFLTSLIYFVNTAYLQWFTKNPETSEIIMTASLGIMFIAIGFMFYSSQSTKK